MAVLIVEDDLVMQDLLATLVRSHDHEASVFTADTVTDALTIWREQSLQLILCDLSLSGGQNGMVLVKQVRASGDEVPVILITGTSDRATVVDGARNRVNGYIVKPFDPEVVAERLKPFIEPEALELSDDEGTTVTLLDWLSDLEARLPQLSIASPECAELAELQSGASMTVRELAKRWDHDTLVSARLLQVANNRLMKREGQVVSSLLEAISVLGVEMSAKLILAEKIRQGDHLQHPYLRTLSEQYAKRSNAIATRAASLAHSLGLDLALCYTAGIMAYLGEQVMLEAIQHYVSAQGVVDDRAIDEALEQLGGRYGNYVKLHWRIPLALRERVGAIHWLPEASVKAELNLMRIAACQALGQTDAPEYARLLRLLGLEHEELATGSSS